MVSTTPSSAPPPSSKPQIRVSAGSASPLGPINGHGVSQVARISPYGRGPAAAISVRAIRCRRTQAPAAAPDRVGPSTRASTSSQAVVPAARASTSNSTSAFAAKPRAISDASVAMCCGVAIPVPIPATTRAITAISTGARSSR